MRACLGLAVIATAFAGSAAVAEGCPKPEDEIATDRPDVTNSSLVVPQGSVQVENGINYSGHGDSRSVDGTNSRIRVGVAPCLEVLVDIPTYFGTVRGPAISGFTDVAPAIKWQISPDPGKFDLSVVAGIGLPTGTVGIVPRGPQPYLQAPWSFELGQGWGLNGMFTEFFQPDDPTDKLVTETTVSLEKKVTEKADLFVEYVGDYPSRSGPSIMINSGGSYHINRLEQLDFHIAGGLTREAPDYIFGLGYSWRRDHLF
jgi:Putative MetA-pathway of phenol degradation